MMIRNSSNTMKALQMKSLFPMFFLKQSFTLGQIRTAPGLIKSTLFTFGLMEYCEM